MPPHETERLHDLRALGLDEDPEEVDLPVVERLPLLAARACRRPWAGVTVVDERHHRFLAVEGPLGDPLPRSWSPCARAICDLDDVFEIANLEEAEPFRGSPLVEEQGLRSYAGSPIRSDRGYGLGTVCVFDDRPGRLTPAEREALVTLGKIASLQLQLRRRTRQLERANEELNQFATFVSHELTDPISQIVGNLELLRLGFDAAERLDDEVEDSLEEAIEGAQRLDTMVKDLLRYARASGRSLEKDAVDLEAVVEEVRSALEPVADQIDADVRAEGRLPSVHADAELLHRVLDNLVENAIQHGGQPARVRIGCEEHEDGWRVWVSDEGKGIAPEEQAQVFDLFRKGSGSERKIAASTETSGVGLALCERIVERHGGQIGVESAPGEGSTFWFTLPRNAG